jgi:protein TonB
MTASRTRSTFYSLLIHVAAIAFILYLTTGTNSPITLVRPMLLAARDLVAMPPDDGGGGGGQNQPAPAQLGRLPRQAPRAFTPPVVEIRNADPKLPIEPTILAPSDVVMPAVNVAQWGDPAGILGTQSGGPGKNGGIGTGADGGVGPGHGPGAGPGDGGGVGGPGSRGGRGVFTAPVLLAKTEPAYSEEARKGRVQGMVVLLVEIDTNGRPRDIRVRQPLGFGLEERAIEAVAHWRFRPAYRNGKPVPCTAEVEVNFRLL